MRTETFFEPGLVEIVTPTFSRDDLFSGMKIARLDIMPQCRRSLIPAVSSVVMAGSFWVGSIDLDRAMSDGDVMHLTGIERGPFHPDKWAMMMYSRLLRQPRGEKGTFVADPGRDNLSYVALGETTFAVYAAWERKLWSWKLGANPIDGKERPMKGRRLFYVLN